VLLAAAGAVYYDIYHQGDTANQNARQLLTEYDQAVSQRPAASAPASPLPSASAPAETPVTATASPAPGDYVQPSAPDVNPSALTISLPGYNVIGKLEIDEIGVDLPVIYNPDWRDKPQSAALSKALKVSICWYSGVLPGEQGNMVITGHNYANGAHFGKLGKLAIGDKVVFYTPNGQAYDYVVYDTQVVTPDNAAALSKYQGDYGLTLATCESSGNRRLIVRCKLANT
jgi:LPXTG-site transpeptidase (sortase) family protein